MANWTAAMALNAAFTVRYLHPRRRRRHPLHPRPRHLPQAVLRRLIPKRRKTKMIIGDYAIRTKLVSKDIVVIKMSVLKPAFYAQ